MTRKFMLGVLIILLAAVVGVMLGVVNASANHQDGDPTITCASVSAHFSDFTAADHPVQWHVKIGAGAYQTVVTSDFAGSSGTASANISSLTAGLAGVPTSVSAYATWTAHTGPTTSATATCGEPVTTQPPTTTTEPPTTTSKPSATTTVPPRVVVVPLPVPVPVLVPARFTG